MTKKRSVGEIPWFVSFQRCSKNKDANHNADTHATCLFAIGKLRIIAFSLVHLRVIYSGNYLGSAYALSRGYTKLRSKYQVNFTFSQHLPISSFRTKHVFARIGAVEIGHISVSKWESVNSKVFLQPLIEMLKGCDENIVKFEASILFFRSPPTIPKQKSTNKILQYLLQYFV